MTIQIGTTDVITSGRKIQNIEVPAGNYDDFMPSVVNSIPSGIIDFIYPMYTHTLTANQNFTMNNIEQGRTIMILLDRSGSLFDPTFPAAIEWANNEEPTWDNWRHWKIVLACIGGTTVRGNAIGYTFVGTGAPGSADFQSSFTKPSNWNMQSTLFTPNFSGASVFTECSIYVSPDPSNSRFLVRFQHSDNQTNAVITDVSVPYTGLNNISKFEFQYNVAYQDFIITGTTNNNWETRFGDGPIPSATFQDIGPFNSGTWYDVTNNTVTNGNPDSSIRLCWKAGAVVGNPDSNIADIASSCWAGFGGRSDNLALRITCDEGVFTSTCDLGISATDPGPGSRELTSDIYKEGRVEAFQ